MKARIRILDPIMIAAILAGLSQVSPAYSTELQSKSGEIPRSDVQTILTQKRKMEYIFAQGKDNRYHCYIADAQEQPIRKKTFDPEICLKEIKAQAVANVREKMVPAPEANNPTAAAAGRPLWKSWGSGSGPVWKTWGSRAE